MRKKYFKKILTASIISLLFVQVFYIFVIEPTVTTAAVATDNVIVTLNVTSGITISDGLDTTMTPALGVASNTAVGSSAWIVRTNNISGYHLDVKASASPALVSGLNSFADYTEGVVGTPEAWTTSSGAKEFGYSAYGNDVLTTTWGTGATCGTTTPIGINMKYVGFKTADKTIANSGVVTTTTGTTTNICFGAEQNTVFAPSGTYTATITATATTN